jgi:AraC family ethanolamine operon transcriptional activator
MTRIVFHDFDEFADAINGLSGRFIPIARSQTDWWVKRVSAGRVPIQQVQIGGASTFAGDGTAGTLTLGIPITAPRRIRIDGQPLEDNSLILIKETQLFTFAARQPTLWAGITVPIAHPLLSPEFLESLGARTSTARASTHIQSAFRAVNAARLLVSRICADTNNVGISDSAVAMAAEEETIMIACHVLESSSVAQGRHFGRRPIGRDRVIARVLAMIEESAGEPLLIQDFCRVAEVSERTLRNIFLEYFGAGPMRLVKVRQLHEIHMALAAAEPGTQTVSSIAARLGVWDVDAFTRTYVALYGETPAATLRRPARSRRLGAEFNANWIRYASRKFRGA